MSILSLNNNKGINREVEGNKVEITSMSKVTTDNRVLGLYNNSKTIDKKILDTMISEVKTDALDNIQKGLAVASFAIGSKVGTTTVGIETVLTLATNTDQYLNEDGSVNIKKVSKVVKNFGKNPVTDYRYESVFKYDVNKCFVINKFNRGAEFTRVSAHEIKEFQNRIKMIDTTMIQSEDLVKIALDMDIIGRALQELSIDVTKDKSKDIGYDINSLVSTGNKTTSRLFKGVELISNIDKIIKEKMFKDTVTEEYTMKADFGNKKSMKDADANDDDELKEAYIESLGGDCKDAINKGCIKAFEPLVELFKASNSNNYSIHQTRVELAIAKSSKLAEKLNELITNARVGMDIVNHLYSIKQDDRSIDTEYIREVASNIRNILYTIGTKLGIDPVNVAKIAMSAPFSTIVNGELKLRKRPTSLRAIWDIFPKEFIVEYACNHNDSAETKRVVADSASFLNVKHSDYDLCLGDEIEFEDGFAMTEFGIVLTEEKFSGKAVVTEQGLKAIVDIYAFEKTDAILLTSIYKNNIQDFSSSMSKVEDYSKENDELRKISKKNKEDITEEDKQKKMYLELDIEAIKDRVNNCLGAAISNGSLAVKTKEGKLSLIGKVVSDRESTVMVKECLITSRCGILFL